MIDVKKYEGHTPGPWKATNEWVADEDTSWGVTLSEKKLEDGRENRIGYHVLHKSDAQLIADAPKLLAEVKRYQLKDCAITQAEHMRAQVGDNTWHLSLIHI